MTFTAEEHTSLTMTEPLPGYGILGNNDIILGNSEKYDGMGAVIMTSNEQATTLYTKYDSERFDCGGAVIMTSNEQATTLYTKYACSGSVIFTEGEHTTTTYNEGYY